MKPLCAVFILAVFLMPVFASDGSYQSATLIDLQRDAVPNDANYFHTFCLAVKVDDMSYLLDYNVKFRWSYQPTDLVVGDAVKIRVSGQSAFLQKPGGGELKATVMRRARIIGDAQPAGCAIPVQDVSRRDP